MNRSLGEIGGDAILGQCDLRGRCVVREHRDHYLALASIDNTDSLVRTQLEQSATFLGTAIEHGDIVSSLHEVRRHGRAHVAQPDKSNFHIAISVSASWGRCGGAMNSGPMGFVIASPRM